MSKLNEKQKAALGVATKFLCHTYSEDMEILTTLIVAQAEEDTAFATQGLVAVKEFCKGLIKEMKGEE